MSAANELEALYESKLSHEAQRYLTLQRAYDDLAVSVEERLLQMSNAGHARVEEARRQAAEMQRMRRLRSYCSGYSRNSPACP